MELIALHTNANTYVPSIPAIANKSSAVMSMKPYSQPCNNFSVWGFTKDISTNNATDMIPTNNTIIYSNICIPNWIVPKNNIVVINDITTPIQYGQPKNKLHAIPIPITSGKSVTMTENSARNHARYRLKEPWCSFAWACANVC